RCATHRIALIVCTPKNSTGVIHLPRSSIGGWTREVHRSAPRRPVAREVRGSPIPRRKSCGTPPSVGFHRRTGGSTLHEIDEDLPSGGLRTARRKAGRPLAQ